MARVTILTRFLTGACIVAAFAHTAAAQSDAKTPEVLRKLYECKSITEPMARLACYDGSVGRLEQAEDAGDLVAIDRDAAEEIKRDSFGFNIPSLPKLGLFSRKSDDASADSPMSREEEKAADTIILAIDRTKTLPRGEIRFFLKNGQIWEQNEKTRISRLSKDEENFLHIRKAAMGSYLAQVNGKGPGARVKRRE